ncbi:UvrABC system protein [Dirofilaria immitis]|nr:hypothetical protein [Dirofilaria immitis]
MDNVNPQNLIEFCFDHTQNILPCLVTKLGLTKGISVSIFSLFLSTCELEAQNNKSSSTTEMQQILRHLLRLYAYFCAYSNIIDLHRNRECFRYLMKRCVLNKPDESCMFYHCGKIHFNLSKSSRKILFTRQHDTTKIVNLGNKMNQLATFNNHQVRSAVVVTLIITFIDMIQ